MGDNALWSRHLGAWEKTGERLSQADHGPLIDTVAVTGLVESVQSSRQ